MSFRVRYDRSYEPPAPALLLRIAAPGTDRAVSLPVLLDTGTDLTVLPELVCHELGLPVVGWGRLRDATGVLHPTLLYNAVVEVGSLRLEMETAGLGPEALAGRDLLNHLIVTLNGPEQMVELSE